jgi:hypothetical protein
MKKLVHEEHSRITTRTKKIIMKTKEKKHPLPELSPKEVGSYSSNPS